MMNILVSLNVWASEWRNKHVEIHCDNRAVVDIMDRHKTRDVRLGNILRDILFIMAHFNIHLEVKHVMGEKNPVADALSQVHMQKSVDCTHNLLLEGYRQRHIDCSHYIVHNDYL